MHKNDKQHLEALEHLRVGKHVDGENLYKQRFLLERRARSLAVKRCCVGVSDKMLDRQHNLIRKAVEKVLGRVPDGFFINGDPRGYALKLEPKSANLPLHTDFGGYQILAPEFEK